MKIGMRNTMNRMEVLTKGRGLGDEGGMAKDRLEAPLYKMASEALH
jgi:hypothetical protein